MMNTFNSQVVHKKCLPRTSYSPLFGSTKDQCVHAEFWYVMYSIFQFYISQNRADHWTSNVKRMYEFVGIEISKLCKLCKLYGNVELLENWEPKFM